MSYRAIPGSYVGKHTVPKYDRLNKRPLRPCERCGIIFDHRPDQPWCFDCVLAERPPSRGTRSILRHTEEQDEEAITNAIQTLTPERVRAGLAGAA